MTEQLSERVKKTSRIVLALSVIVSLIFLVFAFIQKTEADQQGSMQSETFWKRRSNDELRWNSNRSWKKQDWTLRPVMASDDVPGRPVETQNLASLQDI